MKAEIKDKNGNSVRALKMLGYNISSKELEMILNISEYVLDKGIDTTMRELLELESCVNSLYEK